MSSFRRAMALVVVMAVVVAGASVAVAAGSREVLGAPNTAKMVAKKGGEVRWILPGPRRLDPSIFGTPDAPMYEELLPLSERAVVDGVYQTAAPGPFSDTWAPSSGSAKVKVRDVTSVSGPTTEDEISATFEFTSPDGKHRYKVVVDRALPRLADHENFGGVGLNIVQHGRTGIGTALFPQVMAFITFWGVADFYVDGELVADNRFVHFMLSERSRDLDGDYHLAFDDEIDHDSMHAHLIMPPVAVTPDGPVDSPLPTGFTLPNGMDQPFAHIMFEEVKATG